MQEKRLPRCRVSSDYKLFKINKICIGKNLNRPLDEKMRQSDKSAI